MAGSTMRYSYGIMDRKKILLYNPQLFLKGGDILAFPSKDFHKWHGDIKEYIDGLYQINTLEESETINVTELNLAVGVLSNITEELKIYLILKQLLISLTTTYQHWMRNIRKERVVIPVIWGGVI